MNIIQNLDYNRHWAGYATAETTYKYGNNKYSFRLIGQRSGEKYYSYKPFFATSNGPSVDLITETMDYRRVL